MRLSYLPHDIYIGGALERFGEYSPDEAALCARAVDGASTIVLAGANIGAIAVPLAKRVAEIHLFEPQAVAFRHLHANLAGFSGVHAHQKALGAHPGQTKIDIPNYVSPGNFGAVALGTGLETVEVTTVDSLALPRLDLLHADVEGMELDVVKGSLKTIHRFRPVLYLECDQPDKFYPLMSLLNAIGYRAWKDEPRIAPKAGPDDPLYRGISQNLLCLPRERDCHLADGLTEAHLDDGGFVFGRLLPVPDREPSLDAALANPHSADIQAMQAVAQFDSGLLSSRELGKFEHRLNQTAPRVRHCFNPFTGEYRQVPLDSWTGGSGLIGWR